MTYFLRFYQIKPWSSFYTSAIESNAVRLSSKWSKLIQRMALEVKKNGSMLVFEKYIMVSEKKKISFPRLSFVSIPSTF